MFCLLGVFGTTTFSGLSKPEGSTKKQQTNTTTIIKLCLVTNLMVKLLSVYKQSDRWRNVKVWEPFINKNSKKQLKILTKTIASWECNFIQSDKCVWANYINTERRDVCVFLSFFFFCLCFIVVLFCFLVFYVIVFCFMFFVLFLTTCLQLQTLRTSSLP